MQKIVDVELELSLTPPLTDDRGSSRSFKFNGPPETPHTIHFHTIRSQCKKEVAVVHEDADVAGHLEDAMVFFCDGLFGDVLHVHVHVDTIIQQE